MSLTRRQLVQSATLVPLLGYIPVHAQGLSTIPGTPTPTFPRNLYGPQTFAGTTTVFQAEAFQLPTRPAGTTGLYVEFDIDNFANYLNTNAVLGKHFAVNLYDNKSVAPFKGRPAGVEGFGNDAISTGVGVAIGNLGFGGNVYQCAWLEAFRKGNIPYCQKEPGTTNRDKILMDYGLEILTGTVNQVTVKVWAAKDATTRYAVGVQIVNRANGAKLLSGGTSTTPAVAVYDTTGYRIAGPDAGTTDTTKTQEYSFATPTVSLIAVTAGNVEQGINDTPRISAGRYGFY
ncbi:hypothetical protein [Acidovorax sp.]|uniref:hypothetical protein n=1 Tax=Acidovorax sp. TaxID=1872122 RepID=UPI0025BC2358|nr:hypothetical protein [Acidovorax sp.]MCI5070133.1 hypothetical protein [Acidovorax sp.]